MFLVLSMSGVSLAYSHKEHMFGLLPPIHLEREEDTVKQYCEQFISKAVTDLTDTLHLPTKLSGKHQVEGLFRKELADFIVARMGNPPDYLRTVLDAYDTDDMQLLAVFSLYCSSVNKILQSMN